MIDPLHQFMIQPLYNLKLAGWDVSFTNSSLFMGLTVVSLWAFIARATANASIVPGRLQYIAEAAYNLVAGMLKDHVGEEGKQYFPFVFSLFIFILAGNCFGMLPYSFTFTSHIAVTFALAFIVFVFVTILGFMRHGWHFFRLFYPEGTPIYIAPLLVPVEIMSYLTRPISLSVRLFANMVAGHAMLKIFAGFVILLAGTKFFPISVLPFAVNLAITGFEFMVAFLQAYVFTVLTCIYLNDAINLH